MQEQTIFTEALERHDPAERAAFLDQVCAANSSLRQRINRLLQRHDQAGNYLESPAISPDTTAAYVSEQPGTMIGRYRLLEQIGEGGFGVVYMAEQKESVRRMVALKILKPGMDSKQVVARFEAERQALAVMDHPHIAKVLDAGTTATGRPYFVMELVKGISITAYCDQARLTPRQRLELFGDVCAAVQHAHQKGIIHRDLKPSNILVTLHDGTPVVKVIDFGIAKALGGLSLTERTLFTGFAQMVGTPLYMSPEQAALSGLDLDTRSDVYALGVLLYELLTGTTPFDKEALAKAGYDEMRRIIREEEPPRPSTRLTLLEVAHLSTISDQRGIEPKKLSQHVRGELDWIVMKALEKDRNRRYDSANALAADVQRYLNDEAVAACPPSTAYRLRKYARRNKVAIVIGGLAAALLILGVGGLAVNNWLVTRERNAALAQRKLSRQAVDEMYTEVAEKLFALPQLQDKQEEFLKKALALYEKLAESQSEDREGTYEVAQALRRVAKIYYKLGQRDRSEQALGRAAVLLAGLAADYPKESQYRRELAASWRERAENSFELGRLPEAEWDLRAGLHVLQTGAVPDAGADLPPPLGLGTDMATAARQMPGDLDDLRVMADLYKLLGRVGAQGGNPVWAMRASFQAQQLLERLAASYPDEAAYREELAQSLKEKGSVPDLRRAVELWAGLAADFPVEPKHRLRLAGVHRLLAEAMIKTDPKDPEVSRHLGQALALGTRLVADRPNEPGYRVDLARTHQILAYSLKAKGIRQGPEFDGHVRQAIDLMKREADAFPTIEENRDLLAIMFNDVANLLPPGEGKKGLYRQSLEHHFKEVARNPQIRRFRQNLAITHHNLANQTRGKERIWHSKKAIEIYRQLLAEHPETFVYKDPLVGLLYTVPFEILTDPDESVRDPRQAIAYLEEVIRISGVKEWLTNIALAHLRMGEAGKAAQILEEMSIPDSEGIFVLSQAYARLGQMDKAREQFARAEQRMKESNCTPEKLIGNGRWLFERAEAAAFLGIHEFQLPVPQDRFCLARGYWEKGDKEQALKWYHDGVAWMEKHAPKDESLQQFRTEAAILLGLQPPPVFQEPKTEQP